MTGTVRSQPQTKILWRIVHVCIALLGIFWCYRLAVDSVKGGISRLFNTVAVVQGSPESADRALRLNPADPEVHYTRGVSLVNVQRLNEAVDEFRTATRMRPHHYYEWLDLGVTLERVGDVEAALASLRESVRLAPHFAQPRWQLGNLLYRQGRFDEAFNELNLGAKANPNLMDSLLSLAWVASEGDVAKIESFVRPQRRRDYLLLARFLERQGKGADAAAIVRRLERPQEQSERNLLREIVSDLLAAKRFDEAYQVWSVSRGGAPGSALANGDFSEPIQNDRGFGWQVDTVPNISVSVDAVGFAGAAHSIRLEYGGDSSPGYQPLHQFLVLRPNTRYVLTFVARADHLVSGGPPIVVVLDAKTDERRILGVSKAITPQADGSPYTVEFATDQNAPVVLLAVQRNPCTQNPCPIFGVLWLTRFSLTQQ